MGPRPLGAESEGRQGWISSRIESQGGHSAHQTVPSPQPLPPQGHNGGDDPFCDSSQPENLTWRKEELCKVQPDHTFKMKCTNLSENKFSISVKGE